MAETMFKTAQEMLDQRRKDTQDNLLTIKAIEGKQRERPLSGYAKAGGMLGEKLGTMAGEGLKDYFGIKNEGDYLRDYESGIEQRALIEQNLGAEGSSYSPEVASQILSQQDRFIEESGSNLTPEIRRASDLTRDMKGLTPEQLGNPMNVASIYNKHGYTQEAINLLQQNRMTPYQQRSLDIAQQNADTAALTANQFNFGGGTGATTPATTPVNELPPGTVINIDGVPNVKTSDGVMPKAQFDAQEQVKEEGYNYEPSQFDKTLDFLYSPFKAMGESMDSREILGQAQMVSKALETKEYRSRDLDAMRDLVKLPQEDSGLTKAQYNQAILVVTANPE